MVPMTVEITVAASATMTLFQVASTNSGSRKMARYQSNEKCSQTVKRDELKLKIASVSSGRCRNAKNPTAYTANQRFMRAVHFHGGGIPKRARLRATSATWKQLRRTASPGLW